MTTTALATRDQGRALLRVAELFGPTFQGEGPSTGQRAVFVRLSGCNLDCGWCDTPYTWDWSRFTPEEESRQMPSAEILEWVLGHQAGLVVITGGEPLIQQRRLVPLIQAMSRAGRDVEIETNGTIVPDPALAESVTRFNVSPKLRGSGVDRRRAIRPLALSALQATGKAVFKFVIAEPADVHELAALQSRLALEPVWVMPEGTTTDAVLAGARSLAEASLAHGWNLTVRLHVLLWGDERGR